MPGVKISNLPIGVTPLTGTEVVPAVQSGTTVKLPFSALGIGTPATVVFSTASDEPVTYTPPANARFLYVYMIGGGGGGGGGHWASYPTYGSAFGGGGGGAGQVKQFWFPLDPKPSYIGITVGSGGIGGAAGTSSEAATAGADGNPSLFTVNYPNSDVFVATANRGIAGLGGLFTPGENGAPPLLNLPWNGQGLGINFPYNAGDANNPLYTDQNWIAGGGGSDSPPGPTAPGVYGPDGVWVSGYSVAGDRPSGGGGGGSINLDYAYPCTSGFGGASVTQWGMCSGGNGLDSSDINGKNGNTAENSADFLFSPWPTWLPAAGNGGSGGGASSFSYSSGNGGNGFRGGGGGGGGGFLSVATSSANAGDGGNGGDGIVMIYEFY